jgi:predicted nucleotidyltransferase
LAIERLITSRARLKILSLFLLTPASEFHIREVARRTQLNLNSVRRELDNLEAADLLRSRKQGSLKLYSANRENPIYEELKRIFLKTVGMGKVIKDSLAPLGKIETAFIYGSFSTGDEKPGSDIDLFIVGEIEQAKAAAVFEHLQRELSREINYVIFSPKEYRKRKAARDPFVSNVLSQRKIVLVNH